ncbi:hypothetical protein [Wolbachia endosymbiont of Dactylopius coccus]
MSDSIGNNRPKTVVKVSGDKNRVQNYNRGNSLNSEHDYSDNLKEVKIWFGESSLIVNRASLDQNIHNVIPIPITRQTDGQQWKKSHNEVSKIVEV